MVTKRRWYIYILSLFPKPKYGAKISPKKKRGKNMKKKFILIVHLYFLLPGAYIYSQAESIENSLSSLSRFDHIQINLEKEDEKLDHVFPIPPVFGRSISNYGFTQLKPQEHTIYKVKKLISDMSEVPIVQEKTINFNRAIFLEQISPPQKEEEKIFWILDEKGMIRQFENGEVVAKVKSVKKVFLTRSRL
ncbi:MAG: hypothetical protein CMP11_00210 [Zetaproteobacteria bacterium]|nr:hypothetical protein [Pseudobdellovibrionaceae bacterium]